MSLVITRPARQRTPGRQSRSTALSRSLPGRQRPAGRNVCRGHAWNNLILSVAWFWANTSISGAPSAGILSNLGQRRDIGDEALDVVMQPARPARRVGRICGSRRAATTVCTSSYATNRATCSADSPVTPPMTPTTTGLAISLSRLRYRSIGPNPLPAASTPAPAAATHPTTPDWASRPPKPSQRALPPRPQLSRHSVVDFRRLRARSQQKSTTRRRSSESDMAGEYGGGGFDSGDGAETVSGVVSDVG